MCAGKRSIGSLRPPQQLTQPIAKLDIGDALQRPAGIRSRHVVAFILELVLCEFVELLGGVFAGHVRETTHGPPPLPHSPTLRLGRLGRIWYHVHTDMFATARASPSPAVSEPVRRATANGLSTADDADSADDGNDERRFGHKTRGMEAEVMAEGHQSLFLSALSAPSAVSRSLPLPFLFASFEWTPLAASRGWQSCAARHGGQSR